VKHKDCTEPDEGHITIIIIITTTTTTTTTTIILVVVVIRMTEFSPSLFSWDYLPIYPRWSQW
jgi:hypothetical protein